MKSRLSYFLFVLSMLAVGCDSGPRRHSGGGSGGDSTSTSGSGGSGAGGTGAGGINAGSGGAGGAGVGGMGAGGEGVGGMGGPGSGGGLEAYPPGPYGTAKGDVIPNISFQGFVDATVDNSALMPIALSDFYNPTGAGVYPAGSPFKAGAPKPKALFFVVNASWAAPCNQEAQVTLPPKYAQYKPMGGEFLSLLEEGPQPGVAATPSNLVSWTTKWNINYPAVLDPAQTLQPSLVAYPTNYIIDLHTMVIVDIIEGVPTNSTFTEFGLLLN